MRRVRALFSRSLSTVLGWMATFSPRIAFLVTDALAVMLSLGSRRYPLRRNWTNYARTLLLSGWTRGAGRTAIHKLVRENEAVRRLRPPMIVATFHIGPILGLGVLSDRLQGETLSLRGTLIGGTDQQRAATFHRAIERLRQNGFVILALDPHEAHRIAAPFLGRTLQLARGPFAMARNARAPIVPLVARWDGREIELIVGEPLPLLDDEQALAAAAAQWLENYLREWPGELSARILELTRDA